MDSIWNIFTNFLFKTYRIFVQLFFFKIPIKFAKFHQQALPSWTQAWLENNIYFFDNNSQLYSFLRFPEMVI